MFKKVVLVFKKVVPFSILVAPFFLSCSLCYAQSPWEHSVQQLQQAFTGPIAKGLALVAIVVGGLTFAFGEGQGKKLLAGIIFGLGMAVGAVNFMNWLFPG